MEPLGKGGTGGISSFSPKRIFLPRPDADETESPPKPVPVLPLYTDDVGV